MSEGPAPGAINPWRSETTVPLLAGPVMLRCTMDTLARLFAAADAQTVPDLYRAWDSLRPEVMRACFRLLAPSPAEADRLWPLLHGVADLARLQSGFYRVTCGMTPEQIAEAEEAEKKGGGAASALMQTMGAMPRS